MFEYKSDIALLHGAFLSAMKMVDSTDKNGVSKDLFKRSESDMNQVASIVNDAVQLSLRGIGSIKWTSKDKELTSERLHAVVFYTTMRSSGIVCGDADTYYQCVMSTFPKMDWSAYVALLKTCQWSKQLVLCMEQLPEDVALNVAQHIFHEIKDEASDYYVKHSLLQVVLWKILRANGFADLSSSTIRFNFEFVLGDKAFILAIDNCPFMNTPCESRLCEVVSFSELLVALLKLEVDPTDEISTLKMFLHGLLTSLKYALLAEKSETNALLTSVNKFLLAAEEFLLSVDFLGLLECASINFFSSELIISAFEDIFWETDIGFLMILIRSGWEELFSNNYDSNFDGLCNALSHIKAIIDSLDSFFSYKMKRHSSSWEQCAKTLIFVVDNKLYGLNRCIEAFFLEKYLLGRKDVVTCLTKSKSKIASNERYMLQMLDGMVKDPLLLKQIGRLYFEALKDTETTLQLKLLNHFLSQYSTSSVLKQENFTVQVAPILNQTTKVNEAASQIIPLCLQSAEDVINKVLHQGVNGNSGQYQFLVEILKFISCVCTYQKSPNQPQLLVSALKNVFSLASCSKEHRNKLKKFLKELFQAIDDKFCVSTCDVLTQCILPNLACNAPSIVMNLSLESLEIILHCCLNTGNVAWLEKLNVPGFILCICQVIDFGICSPCGSVKQIAASIVCLLSKLQDLLPEEKKLTQDAQAWTVVIKKYLSSMHPAVYFYTREVFFKCTSLSLFDIELYSLSLPQLWIFSCIWKRTPIDLLKNKLIKTNESQTYAAIMGLLCQLLPHFTLEEWRHSYILLEECVKLQHGDFSGSSSTCVVLVTKILVDAIMLLKRYKNINWEWTHMVNCLSQVVGAQVHAQAEELCSKILISLLFELFRVTQSVNEDNLKNLTVILLDISKILKTHLQNEKKSEVIDDVSSILCTLPEGMARAQVLENLEKLIS